MENMDKNKELIQEILENIGGKENISYLSHCMTRLRFNLKDKSVVNIEKIEKMEGVLGTQFSSGQYQVIIGPGVEKIYKEMCQIAGIESRDNSLSDPTPKEKWTIKSVFNRILETITSCLTPVLPVLIVSGLIKMFASLLGPTMLNIVGENSDIFRLLTFVGATGFYFFPVFVGLAASKKFGVTPMLALLMGCILVTPDLQTIVTSEEAFTVFGLPMTNVNYAYTVFPIILIIWIMSYVEKYLKKITPVSLESLVVPLGTIIIMLPIGLCVLGPIGHYLGEYLSHFLIWLHQVLGPFGVAIIGALFVLIVATGMHLPLFATAILSITNLGFDNTILVGAIVGVYVNFAVTLGMMLKAKKPEDRGIAFSSFISQFFGGVAEPIIFGIYFRYKRTLVYRMVGSFIGTLYAAFMGCSVYFMGSSNFLYVLAFNGGDQTSFIHGCIACVIGFVVAFGMMLVFGYESTAINENQVENRFELVWKTILNKSVRK